jgi:SAM-dependent methyltransferase
MSTAEPTDQKVCMSNQDAWQLAHDAAVAYEKDFVPAIFAQWPPVLAEIAGIKPGDRVLDVACGTGVLAREAATRVGSTGRVTGLDLNRACWLSRDGCARKSIGGKAMLRSSPLKTTLSMRCSANSR